MLIKEDHDFLTAYLEDYSNIKGGFCDSVVFPESEEEICDFLRSSSLRKVPVTISAGGTGVTGARIPFGGVVLSVEKLNRIERIEKLQSGSGIAIVQPGVMLKDFLEIVENQHLFYPPDPTEKSSFISGNVATSASGARSFKFGTTRDYVIGLRVVISNGKIIELERGRVLCEKGKTTELPLINGGVIKASIPQYTMPDIKNAAGYYIKDGMDAIDLFIGQEGTLGVITKIRLKLLERPDSIIACYTFFKNEKDYITFIHKARELSLKKRAGISDDIDAISLEFFDSYSLSLLREKHKNIPSDSSGAVYFEQETDKKTESSIIDRWARLITECGGSLENTWFACNKQEMRILEDIRHDLPDMVNELIKRKKQQKIGTDIAVSYRYISDMIEYYNGLLAETGLKYVIFGHIGDGHLHVNILPKDDKEYNKGRQLYIQFVKRAVSLGGTVSAEHGIGKSKHCYLEMMYGTDAIRQMVRLKKSLDPACILGLDNIFSKEMLNMEELL